MRERRRDFRRLSPSANFGISFFGDAAIAKLNDQRHAQGIVCRRQSSLDERWRMPILIGGRHQLRCVTNSIREPECRALFRPGAGNSLQQAFDSQGAWLAPFDDRLNDIGRKIAEAQEAADVSIVELEALCNFHCVRILFATKSSHPDIGSRYRQNEIVAQSSCLEFDPLPAR